MTINLLDTSRAGYARSNNPPGGFRSRRIVALISAVAVILSGAFTLALPAGATTIVETSPSRSTTTGTTPTATGGGPAIGDIANPDEPFELNFYVVDASPLCPQPGIAYDPQYPTYDAGCQIPLGTVDVYVDGAFQQSLTLSDCFDYRGLTELGETCASGSFTFAPPRQTVSYYYSGDSLFTPSSGSYIQQVNPAPTTTTLTQSSTTSGTDQPVTFTATVASDPNYAAPTGAVQFTDFYCPKQNLCLANDYTVNPLGDPVPLNGGAATVSTSSLPIGTHQLLAEYIGGATWAPSQSERGAVVHTVTQGVTIVSLTSASPSALVGRPVTYTATVIPNPGGGTVAFADGGTGPIVGCGSQPVGANGTATCQVAYGVAGSHDIYGSYSGDANFLGSSSLGAYTQVVQQPTTVSLTSSALSVRVGQAVTYTATVSPAPGGGTVAFSDGGTPIASCGSQPVGAGGAANCQTTYAVAGTHTISAVFSGNGTYAASPSTPGSGGPPPLTQTVIPDTDLAITIPANITTDATGPGGATVSYGRPTVSDEEIITPAPTCSPVSGSTFAVGITPVTCTAGDPDDTPSIVTTTFTVTVRGAPAQLSDLHQAVIGVGPGTSLADKVTQAQRYLAAGDIADTCSTLSALVHQVQAQSDKAILAAQAATLISDAQRIQAVLGC